MLTTFDYIAIALYAAALLAIGFFSSKKQTTDSFLIADRKLGVWSGLFTINATKTGSIIIIYTAILYDYGLSALWYFLGVIIGYVLFLPFASTLHARSNKQYYTLADYFSHKFGSFSRIATSLCTIALMGGFLATNLIAVSKVLSFYSGIPFAQSAIFVSSIILVYLALAGFSAVVKTDVFQYIAMVTIMVLFLFPLSQGVTIPASDFDVFAAGIPDIIGFMLFGILIAYASPDLWQRVYAFDSPRVMRKSILYSLVVYLFVCLVLTLIGLLIKTHLPDADPDIAIIRGFADLLPMGMRGLAIVVFFAAMMSTVDTYAYTAASAIVQDFFKKLSKAQTVTAIRWVITGMMVLGTGVAIIIQDLLNAAYIFGGFYVVIAIPAIASALVPRISARSIHMSFFCSIVAIAIVVPYGLLTDTISPILSLQVMLASIVGLAFGGCKNLLHRNHSL